VFPTAKKKTKNNYIIFLKTKKIKEGWGGGGGVEDM